MVCQKRFAFGVPKLRALLNGTRIPIDEAFMVGNSKLMFPNDASLGSDAEEIVNCRCTLKFDDGKPLTNSDERGIMRVGSGRVSTISAEREQEYGVPYGADAVNADMEYINSEEFAKKFKNITENKAVNETLLQCARKAISHRNGTLYEDMYLINGDTGEIMASQLNTPSEQSINHNEEMKKALIKAKANNIPVIALHTHPEGFPPSVDDFNSAFKFDYSLGVVAGHNGQVYLYRHGDEYIDDSNVVQLDIAMAYKRGVDIDRAHKEVYDEYGLEYDIAKE